MTVVLAIIIVIIIMEKLGRLFCYLMISCFLVDGAFSLVYAATRFLISLSSGLFLVRTMSLLA